MKDSSPSSGWRVNVAHANPYQSVLAARSTMRQVALIEIGPTGMARATVSPTSIGGVGVGHDDARGATPGPLA